MKKKAKRPGRPVTTGRGHDGVRVNVRLSASEYAAIKRRADLEGADSVAAWMRAMVMAVVRGDI